MHSSISQITRAGKSIINLFHNTMLTLSSDMKVGYSCNGKTSDTETEQATKTSGEAQSQAIATKGSIISHIKFSIEVFKALE